MKKISLKNIKDALTRDEMRTVMAGSGYGGKKCGRCYSAYDCGSGCDLCAGGHGGQGYCEKYS
jgi:hypothetical protein